MIHKTTRRLMSSTTVVAWAILGSLTVSAQAQGGWLEQLRKERLRAVESALVEVSRPPVPAPIEAGRQEAVENETSIPVWARHLSADTWQQMRERFETEGVPTELMAVGWVESRFNPQALSPKGARGVWQLMPSTARQYGLRVDPQRDDRTDLQLSTQVAARHLADLYDRFGDWLLVLAAYNAGPERIDGAMARARTRDFWSLRPWLPVETREYVPSVLRTVALPQRDGMIVGPHQHSRAQRAVASVSISEPSTEE